MDAIPDAVDGPYALTVRHLVAAGCRIVLEAGQQATGPGLLAFEADHARRTGDLRLYIERRHHGADLAEVGRAGLNNASSG